MDEPSEMQGVSDGVQIEGIDVFETEVSVEIWSCDLVSEAMMWKTLLQNVHCLFGFVLKTMWSVTACDCGSDLTELCVMCTLTKASAMRDLVIALAGVSGERDSEVFVANGLVDGGDYFSEAIEWAVCLKVALVCGESERIALEGDHFWRLE